MRYFASTVSYFFMQILVIGSLFAGWIAAGKIQQAYFPVIEDMTIVAIGIDDQNRLLLKPAINKVRDCVWVGASWWVTLENGRSMQVALDYPSRVEGDQSAPPGYTIQDVHRVSQRAFQDAVSQFGVIKHNCFGIFTIEYRIGPMPIVDRASIYDPSFLARLNKALHGGPDTE